MRLKAQRKAIYVAMGLTVLALSGGFALASFGLGGHYSAQQSSATTTIGPVSGLSYNSTSLTMLAASVTNTSCAGPAGCNVTVAGATDCAGGVPGHTGCLLGDWIEQVTLNTTAAANFTGVVQISLFVTANGDVYSGTTFYYHDVSGNARVLITQDFDIGSGGSGPADVTSVSVVASVN